MPEYYHLLRRSAPEKVVVCFKTVAELRPLNSATVLKHTTNFGAPNRLLVIHFWLHLLTRQWSNLLELQMSGNSLHINMQS